MKICIIGTVLLALALAMPTTFAQGTSNPGGSTGATTKQKAQTIHKAKTATTPAQKASHAKQQKVAAHANTSAKSAVNGKSAKMQGTCPMMKGGAMKSGAMKGTCPAMSQMGAAGKMQGKMSGTCPMMSNGKKAAQGSCPMMHAKTDKSTGEKK